MTNLSSWKIVTANKEQISKEEFSRFSRLNARYSLASGFEAMTCEGISQQTTESYFVALRVTLAFTALEAFEKASKSGSSTLIRNVELTKALRSSRNTKLMDELGRSIEIKKHPREHEAFQSFMKAENDNLRPVIYAIRNLMAHGVLTANRLGLDTSSARRILLNEIATHTLREIDEKFSRHVKKLFPIT